MGVKEVILLIDDFTHSVTAAVLANCSDELQVRAILDAISGDVARICGLEITDAPPH